MAHAAQILALYVYLVFSETICVFKGANEFAEASWKKRERNYTNHNEHICIAPSVSLFCNANVNKVLLDVWREKRAPTTQLIGRIWMQFLHDIEQSAGIKTIRVRVEKGKNHAFILLNCAFNCICMNINVNVNVPERLQISKKNLANKCNASKNGVTLFFRNPHNVSNLISKHFYLSHSRSAVFRTK